MLRASSHRAKAAALCVAALAALLAGCTKKGGVLGVECEETVLVGEPGRVVDGQLEMTGRIARKEGRTPVEGLEIEFGLKWERSGSVVSTVKSDASGAAVARYPVSDLVLDARSFGALQPAYSLRWTGRYQVDDVSYCEADGTGSLPVDQLPKP